MSNDRFPCSTSFCKCKIQKLNNIIKRPWVSTICKNQSSNSMNKIEQDRLFYYLNRSVSGEYLVLSQGNWKRYRRYLCSNDVAAIFSI
ncbi:hypothetical protein SLE2022_017580 [Rubroshorea leprosula]